MMLDQELNVLDLAGVTIVELADIMILTIFLVKGFRTTVGIEVLDAAC